MPSKGNKKTRDGLYDQISPEYLGFFRERENQILQTVRQLVEIESPTDNKQAVDRLGSMIAGRFEGLGGRSKFHRTKDFGDHLQVDFTGKKNIKPVMLLGHLDTVYPLGTLARMPCRVAEGRLFGPGSFDMKSGIAFMLHLSKRYEHGTMTRCLVRSPYYWFLTKR